MAFSAFERLVAFRYLRARRREGFVSVIAGFSLAGIALGVATLIIVMSVMNGFRIELLDRILGLNGHLGVYGTRGAITEYQALANEIRGLDGVRLVTPTVEGQAMVTNGDQASGAVVRGVAVEDLKARQVIREGIIAGSLDALDDGEPGVLIGQRLARKLGTGLGGTVTLISPQGHVTAFGTVPRMRAYPVKAVFDIGMYEYDSGFLFMPVAPAQVYFRQKNGVSHLEVLLDDPRRLDEIKGEIAAMTGPAARIFDWEQSNAGFFNAVKVERNVMFLILTLIILVAAFNIISSLIMLVKDKGRDIAILRTMGATRGMIMRIFFLSGASIGTTGTLIGLALGLLFCENIEAIRQGIQALTGTELFAAEIYFLSQLPAVVDPTEVFWVVAMALGLSFGATVYPSWRAARLDPVEALRYE